MVYLKFCKEHAAVTRKSGLHDSVPFHKQEGHVQIKNGGGKDLVGFKYQTPSDADGRRVKMKSQLVKMLQDKE